MSRRIETLGREFVAARERKDRAVAEEKAAKQAWRDAEEALFEALEDDGAKSWQNAETGERFTAQTRDYGMIIDEDAALESPDIAARLDQLTKPAFAKARLNEYVNELLDNNQPMPDGIGYYTKRSIHYSRGGKR